MIILPLCTRSHTSLGFRSDTGKESGRTKSLGNSSLTARLGEADCTISSSPARRGAPSLVTGYRRSSAFISGSWQHGRNDSPKGSRGHSILKVISKDWLCLVLDTLPGARCIEHLGCNGAYKSPVAWTLPGPTRG